MHAVGRQRCREGGSRSLLAGLRRYFDATSSMAHGEPPRPNCPASQLTCSPYSRLVRPCSQAADRRCGQLQVLLLLGLLCLCRGRYRRAAASRPAGDRGSPHIAGRGRVCACVLRGTSRDRRTQGQVERPWQHGRCATGGGRLSHGPRLGSSCRAEGRTEA